MKTTEHQLVEWFLRISLSAGMLSAVADRFGWWSPAVSAWGNWDKFIAYTQQLNPWVPATLIGVVGGLATAFEITFALGLLTKVKTALIAKATGCLLLLFALSMTFTSGIKAPLDYSIFVGAAAAFALSILTKKTR